MPEAAAAPRMPEGEGNMTQHMYGDYPWLNDSLQTTLGVKYGRVAVFSREFRSCARGRQWCGIIHYY